MLVVRGDDDDEIQSFRGGPRRLGHRHLAMAAVDAIGRKEQIRARITRTLGVRRERARHQFRLSVHLRGDAVHAADEGAATATDHAETQLASDHPRVSLSCAGCAAEASNAASKARALGLKSSRRTNAAASVAPWTRSMRASSHSTDSGPR